MAELVRELVDDHGYDLTKVQQVFGMEDEEALRLLDNSGAAYRMGAEDFGKGWVPKRD